MTTRTCGCFSKARSALFTLKLSASSSQGSKKPADGQSSALASPNETRCEFLTKISNGNGIELRFLIKRLEWRKWVRSSTSTHRTLTVSIQWRVAVNNQIVCGEWLLPMLNVHSFFFHLYDGLSAKFPRITDFQLALVLVSSLQKTIFYICTSINSAQSRRQQWRLRCSLVNSPEKTFFSFFNDRKGWQHVTPDGEGSLWDLTLS